MNVSEVIETAKFLFSNKIITHLDTTDGGFYNGLIIELSENLIILHDRILGKTPIAVSSVKIIRRFRE